MRAGQLSRRAFVMLSSGILAGFVISVWLGELAARHVMKIDPPGGLAEADARAKVELEGTAGRLPLRELELVRPLPNVALGLDLRQEAMHAEAALTEGVRYIAPFILPALESARASVAPDRLEAVALPLERGETSAHASLPIAHGAYADAPDGRFLLVSADPSPYASAVPAPRVAEPASIERSVVVSKGDTLNDILLREGVPAPEAHDAIAAMKSMVDARALKPGIELKLTFAADTVGQDRLLKVSLPTSPAETVRVERDGNDAFSASRIAHPLARRLVRTEGFIRSSLYEDAVAAGIPPNLIVELIRAFSYDVDFQREIQPGDRFEIVFEQFMNARGTLAKTGSVVYAALTLSGQRYKIYRFERPNGFVDYFNAKGESVRKALLRTPIDGARISSGYGMRLHPILGYTTMHKGVDFAAPTGTPIMAAGDGVVQLAGRRGNYGIYLRVEHNKEYSTAYAHMSAIARGIHVGSHVRQGQVIGYVGSTGLATGPHLYYEVLVHDHQINPLSVRLPTGVKLAGKELKAFVAMRDATDASIAALPLPAKVAKTAF